jgi:hypothetical protein
MEAIRAWSEIFPKNPFRTQTICKRKGAPNGAPRFLNALVFFAGCHTTADMTLPLVLLQNFPGLQVQRPIASGQPLLKILVDGGFGDAEMPCGGSDSCAVFNDVHSQLAGSLLDGVGHTLASDAGFCRNKPMLLFSWICFKKMKIHRMFTRFFDLLTI